MLSKEMEKALNEQINAELFSGYIYLGMSAALAEKNLTGSAHWMKLQAKEELGHAMKIFGFVIERGGKVELKAVGAPKQDWKSLLEVFAAAYEHEKKVTGMIEKLVELARGQKDYATESFLKWFIDEQVEEEANALDVLSKLQMIGDSPGPIFMLDAVLGKRE